MRPSSLVKTLTSLVETLTSLVETSTSLVALSLSDYRSLPCPRTRGRHLLARHITAVVHELEGFRPLRGLGFLVVVVEAARGGDVLAPSLVRRTVTSFTFAAGVVTTITLHVV